MDILKLLLCAPAVALLLFTGFFLSFSSRWIQIRRLPEAFSQLFRDRGRDFSSISALCAIVGGNLGVGNLSGTAVALRAGGPGFIVWMVLIIIVTSIIKYATCYISIMTRTTKGEKTFGGPVVFLRESFKSKWASIVSMVITAICALTVGNMVQVNSLSISMNIVGGTPLAAGALITLLLVMVNIMDTRGVSSLISKVVPLMTVSYFLLASITLTKFGKNIVPSLLLIYENVFSVSSFKNGAILAFIAETLAVIQVGALRGIFATDIGLGLEGTVHSLVNSELKQRDFALQQSLISLVSPLIVAVVALMTTMVLLCTGVWGDMALESTNMCLTAFSNAIGGTYAKYALTLVLFCFSFTTILTWLVCSKEAVSYVFGGNTFYEKCWVVLFTSVLPIGSICTVSFIWNVADLAVSVATIANTVGILLIFSKYRDMFDSTGEKR
ncbi:alanine:cation symporter family protein [Anaplasma bovis]|uniref:alanine:cation symporter family protein n=1 Tax=Anaplasma bovis TaxID=186733 RepID=UPI002FEF401B